MAMPTTMQRIPNAQDGSPLRFVPPVGWTKTRSFSGGVIHNDIPNVLFKGITHASLLAAQANAALPWRTRCDSNGNVRIFMDRPSTDADPILEKFLGN